MKLASKTLVILFIVICVEEIAWGILQEPKEKLLSPYVLPKHSDPHCTYSYYGHNCDFKNLSSVSNLKFFFLLNLYAKKTSIKFNETIKSIYHFMFKKIMFCTKIFPNLVSKRFFKISSFYP